mmetsp:Transcript_20189/g.30440  ORF Transcript_20189/g.30440 Transcript_20189/m.30440 type:complete len:102 (+) Transcript_20189:1926-2231(+)
MSSDALQTLHQGNATKENPILRQAYYKASSKYVSGRTSKLTVIIPQVIKQYLQQSGGESRRGRTILNSTSYPTSSIRCLSMNPTNRHRHRRWSHRSNLSHQ